MIDHRFNFSRKQFIVATAFLIIVSVVYAWKTRFVIDDAFISFRYAHNLVSGYGLVWNPGEIPLEGYTNFLWVLLMSIPLYFGYEPILFSYILGIGCFAVTIYITLRLSSLLFTSRGPALLVIVLLGTNPSFRSFSTGGLETMLQALLFTSTIYIAALCIHEQFWSVKRIVGLSILASMAVLTRLDSMVLLVVIVPVAVLNIMREESDQETKLGRVLAGIIPFSLIVGGWLIWKLHYYGGILPNTFYIRVFSFSTMLNGFYYVFAFLGSYLLLPLALIGLFALPKLYKLKNLTMPTIAMVVILWSIYVMAVGGDWMEFRFMVPITPILFILAIWLVIFMVRNNKWRVALILMLLVGPINFGYEYNLFTARSAGINNISGLSGDAEAWTPWGMMLGKAFDYSHEVKIATTAAGAIPYYSRLNTIDMLGLTDRWVATHGVVAFKVGPGHQKLADLSYLIRSKVNIVIGLVGTSAEEKPKLSYDFTDLDHQCMFMCLATDWHLLPADATIIEAPIYENYKLVLLYLTQSQVVDQTITREGWRVVPINKDGD